MKVLLLTKKEAEMLEGKEFAPSSFFGKQQDADDNNYIGLEERDQCVNDEFMWVKDLPEIDFKPKPFELLKEINLE